MICVILRQRSLGKGPRQPPLSGTREGAAVREGNRSLVVAWIAIITLDGCRGGGGRPFRLKLLGPDARRAGKMLPKMEAQRRRLLLLSPRETTSDSGLKAERSDSDDECSSFQENLRLKQTHTGRHAQSAILTPCLSNARHVNLHRRLAVSAAEAHHLSLSLPFSCLSLQFYSRDTERDERSEGD